MSSEQLISFLSSPKPEVTRLAMEGVLPLTPSASASAYLFKNNDYEGLRSIKKLSLESQDKWTVQNALIGLINLSDDSEIRAYLSADPTAVQEYAKMASSPQKNDHTKYACMLVSNLAREKDAAAALEGEFIMSLIAAFVKRENLEDESYDYLAFAFGEIARTSLPTIVNGIPYLFPQLSAKSALRRTGVAAAIKNALFDVELHLPFIQKTPLLELIMLRLKGPELMDDEDWGKLPAMVRTNSGPSKEREPSLEAQILLIECLLMLTTTKLGRDELRAKNVYLVIREVHKDTSDSDVAALCEKYVNMVMRGDPNEEANNSEAIEAVPGPKVNEANDNDDEEEGVTEIV